MNTILSTIVDAACRYSGCQREAVLGVGRGTEIVTKTRLVIYRAARAAEQLEPLSRRALVVQIGRVPSWAVWADEQELDGWTQKGVDYVKGLSSGN
jgi:hypothetical protein